MSIADLRKQADIAPNTMTKLRRDEAVNLAIFMKICKTLNCDFGDIIQYISDEEIKLHPCVYLHNYPRQENDPLDAEQYSDVLAEAPAFTYGQREQLRTFIKKEVTVQNLDKFVLFYFV